MADVEILVMMMVRMMKMAIVVNTTQRVSLAEKECCGEYFLGIFMAV
jgi:hypothetical protein